MKAVNENNTEKNQAYVADIVGDTDFLFIAYHPMFSDVMSNLDFSNGKADLNDFDEFLENTVPGYQIGVLTMPELEFLQCLVYGISHKYARVKGCKNFLKFSSEIEVAYHDICKISRWISSLFTDRLDINRGCLFTVASSGEVKLVYRKPGHTGKSNNVASISVTPSKFNFKEFSEFCSFTKAPLQNMDINSATAIHYLISENVSFICGLGEVKNNKNRFSFQLMQKNI